MRKTIPSVLFGLIAVAGVSLALTAEEGDSLPAGPVAPDMVVLGEEDLGDRAEILRNMYRRITPPEIPLVQDVGTWPAAWEEFGANWASAAADREYGAWVVPVEVTQDAGATVVKDGNGAVLWRGWTDFARPESADVVLTGGLVAEEDWDACEALRGAVAAMTAEPSRVELPGRTRTSPTNSLRFTSHEWTSNDTFRLELAYEIDTNVDVFAYAVACTSSLVVATWTNDENQVVTDTNTVWTSVGLPFNGMESDWELRGTVAIGNGVAEFEDSGFSEELSRLRFYAAAVAQDSDGDGLNDGWEDFVSHTDPGNQDSDGDGIDDATELATGTSPSSSNVWWVTVSTNTQYERFGLPDCTMHAPANFVRNYPIVGAAPTTNSIVSNVTVSGFVDDAIKVDSNEVDFVRNVQTFTNRCITNEILNLQSKQFNLELWDYPRDDYEGPNEAKIGWTNTEPFRVEWTWMVPMEFRLEHITTDGNPLVANPSGTRTNRVFTCKATVLPTNIPDSAICWSCTNAGMSFDGGVTNGRTVQLVASQPGAWEATVTVRDSTLGAAKLHGSVLEKKSVPIYLHIVRENNGSGGAMTLEHFQTLLGGANQIHEQSAIKFYVENVVYFDNSEWLNISSSNDWAEYNQLQSQDMNTGGIEVYCVHRLEGDLPGLTSIFPGASAGLTIAAIASSGTLAHELGHVCGLEDIYVDWPPEAPYLSFPPFPVERGWEQQDWCAEISQGGYGDLTQPDLIRRLLMYGVELADAVDIPAGTVRGINEYGVQTHVPVGLSGMGNRQPAHW